MKNLTTFLLLLTALHFYGCSGRTSNNKVENKEDTLKKHRKVEDNAEEAPEPLPATILADRLKSYKEVTRIDTTVILGVHDTMFVKTRFYCLYDHNIDLPARYLEMYHLKKFITHNFAMAVQMKINSKIVFNDIIRKEDFFEVLDKDGLLKKYGVLFAPYLEITNSNLSINFSLTIPLTDVGKPYMMQIDAFGRKHVYSEEQMLHME